jgi:hypothetical protein
MRRGKKASNRQEAVELLEEGVPVAISAGRLLPGTGRSGMLYFFPLRNPTSQEVLGSPLVLLRNYQNQVIVAEPVKGFLPGTFGDTAFIYAQVCRGKQNGVRASGAYAAVIGRVFMSGLEVMDAFGEEEA